LNPKNNLFKCKFKNVFIGFTTVEIKFELVLLPREALFANKFWFVPVETCDVSKQLFSDKLKQNTETLEREGTICVGKMDNGLVCYKEARKRSTTRVACQADADI